MDWIFIFFGFFIFGYICGVGAIGDFMKDNAYVVIEKDKEAHGDFMRKVALLSAIATVLTVYLA